MIKIEAEFDPEAIKETIASSQKLEDDHKVFEQLASIAKLKKQLANAQDEFDQLEREAKQAINDRAKSLYGEDWSAIKGDKFKIVRYLSGSVYEIVDTDAVDTIFVKKVDPTLDTDAIDVYRETKSSLPDGIGVNPNRKEVIRVSVNDD